MSDYVITVRNVEGKNFGTEPGSANFLKVPINLLPKPTHAIAADDWIREVLREAVHSTDSATGKNRGDILVFIHGYNNGQDIIMKRHRQLSSDLNDQGYKGTVVSFDWPSAEMALNYWEDRSDAKQTAISLVTDCIVRFARLQNNDCLVNVHLLAHSTGAYVVREAFDDADDRNAIANSNWMVSQIMLIGGDISSDCMSDDDPGSDSLYRHCVRLTNYWNSYDSVLKLSNAKRMGMAPRVGRVGLPDNSPKMAVDVDCSAYFDTLDEDKYPYEFYGTFCHSWHIGNPVFTKDVIATIQGDMDRNKLPTRRTNENGELVLSEA